ncbi:MAG TPA: outer membrane beta-barrel protein [Verrucomicrobiae bacterium]|nr:outer membrane beta-barrel protein [Verrucomicrobiae bacterium]
MFKLTNSKLLLRIDKRVTPIFLLIGALWVAATPFRTVAQNSQPIPNASAAQVQDLAQQVAELRAVVQELQAQVRDLQKAQPQAARVILASNIAEPSPVSSASPQPAPAVLAESAPVQSLQPQTAATSPAQPEPKPFNFLYGTTVNFLVDTYYEYNFNQPIGRVNELRAYDVLSNAFSLNQADIVLENAADPVNGKRWGARVDLQFGQATETLQGNSANEPRPDIYRNIFQAYGTYVAPLGSGLAIDFGKWASSLGIEGNYGQDQMNYSRSYWFDFLPFYHMGVRAHYQFNDKIGVNYWIVNGTNQTEPYNGYKDQMIGLVLSPVKNLNWTINYYRGQEHPDFVFVTNGPPNLPTLQGTPFEPIVNPPTGKTNIFDSYATWNITRNWTAAAEADYEVERLYTNSLPAHADGGALYLRYQFTPKIAFAARSEYLADSGALYSGKAQALKEATATFEYRFSQDFLMREEWRRDWSNQPFFLSDTLGVLEKSQNTATLGLIWWFGGKEGAW